MSSQLGMLLVACGCLLAASMLHAEEQMPGPEHPLVRAIDAIVSEAGITADTPGVAIYAVQPGQWRLSKGYGLAVVDEAARITPQTRFELASLSKPFTAIAVLILCNRGELSLEDDVRKHLPELPAYNAAQTIRVVDLLHHVSGLPEYLTFENVPHADREWWRNEDYVSEFARQRRKYPRVFAPRARFKYCNTGYMLLALIVQRVTGKSFGAFMREEVFEPAGMESTFVYESPEAAAAIKNVEQSAIGYAQDDHGVWQPQWGLPPRRQETLLTVGDGAIWSTLEDMARWDAALREGKYLKPETTVLALKPSQTADGQTNQYGFGLSLYPDGEGGLYGYGHEGSWGGFRTSYYRYLSDDRSMVILSNKGDFDPDAFWYKLNDAIEQHAPR